jgi:formamidopyrimidine-DNA glycosylase
MPEAPDLFVVRSFLEPKLNGRTITAAAERKPLVLRNMTGRKFTEDITGRRFSSVGRKGKLLFFGLGPERLLVVSPMLTGVLRYCSPGDRMEASAIITLDLGDGSQLRYLDQKRMGQVYYLPPKLREQIVRLENQGPDVIDEPLGFEQFIAALKPFRGEVKGILTRGQAVSGIGNAYADEILFSAGISPFRKKSRLSTDELKRLHTAVHEVPLDAVRVLEKRVGANIHKKVRDFLKVHGKGGEPCPVCGSRISAITANRRETNFCRKCQPGTMFD